MRPSVQTARQVFAMWQNGQYTDTETSIKGNIVFRHTYGWNASFEVIIVCWWWGGSGAHFHSKVAPIPNRNEQNPPPLPLLVEQGTLFASGSKTHKPYWGRKDGPGPLPQFKVRTFWWGLTWKQRETLEKKTTSTTSNAHFYLQWIRNFGGQTEVSNYCRHRTIIVCLYQDVLKQEKQIQKMMKTVGSFLFEEAKIKFAEFGWGKRDVLFLLSPSLLGLFHCLLAFDFSTASLMLLFPSPNTLEVFNSKTETLSTTTNPGASFSRTFSQRCRWWAKIWQKSYPGTTKKYPCWLWDSFFQSSEDQSRKVTNPGERSTSQVSTSGVASRFQNHLSWWSDYSMARVLISVSYKGRKVAKTLQISPCGNTVLKGQQQL